MLLLGVPAEITDLSSYGLHDERRYSAPSVSAAEYSNKVINLYPFVRGDVSGSCLLLIVTLVNHTRITVPLDKTKYRISENAWLPEMEALSEDNGAPKGVVRFNGLIPGHQRGSNKLPQVRHQPEMLWHEVKNVAFFPRSDVIRCIINFMPCCLFAPPPSG